MFDSGIKASDLISQLNGEVDIAYPIPDESYIMWLNALEQLLYTELIQEQAEAEVELVYSERENTAGFTVYNTEVLINLLPPSNMRFEDIHAVYADDTQLIKSTVASGEIFPDTYYKAGDKIVLNTKKEPGIIKFIYFVRPELKTTANYSALNVMIPVEFIDLAKAKLRGEAYKAANEDGLAAKWINDYNVLLETFKAWLSGKQPEFGI